MRRIGAYERSDAEVRNYYTVREDPHRSWELQRERRSDGHRTLRSARRHRAVGAAGITVTALAEGLAVTRMS